MNRTRLAAVPVAMLGIVAGGSVAAATPSDPDPVDSTSTSAPPVSRPIPRGAGPRAAGEETLLDVPERALAAYQRASAVMAPADADCHLSAELLAAVGRVESDHGRYAAWRLGPRARMFPTLVGSPVPETTRQAPASPLADTDGGVFDHDATADHPLGPLQILPGVWRQVVVDGDSDGLRSPDDLDDAALGLAIALCDGDLDLATPAGQEEALARLNIRARYLRSVESFRAAYAAPLPVTPVTVYTIGTIVTPPEPEPTDEPTKDGKVTEPTKPAPATQPGHTPSTSGPTSGPTTPTSPTPTTPTPTPTPVNEPTPTPEPTPDPVPEPTASESSEPAPDATRESAPAPTESVDAPVE